MLLSSDTRIGISKSMGLAQISFSEAYQELQPDLLVVLGDRFEIMSAATSALVAGIPIAHLHGGETTEGAFDESIRHSITKMSHLHFTSTDEYRKRVIQLGENPDRVFKVGALGVENISRLELLNKEKFEESIGFKLFEKNLMVTFHPVTLERNTALDQMSELLKALSQLTNTAILFTKANSDTDGRIINNMIDDFVRIHPKNSIAFVSLGQIRYLSALKYVDGVVGNSSSGLIEAPSFKIGTINIGDRQKGRIKAQSVIDCEPYSNDILESINKLYSMNFQVSLKSVINPYSDYKNNVSKNIVNILKKFSFKNILKKKFFDISFELHQ